MGRWNIILVITHDTGRHLGCYGRDVSTPNLDRLAEEGVRFAQAFCTAPQCSPSRASLLTGLVPHRHGLIGLAHRGFRLKPDVPLLPRILNRVGYATFLFGLQHETSDNPQILGYQHVPPVKSHSCQDVAPAFLEFLSSHPPQPFFASVGFFETHRPFPQTQGRTEPHVPPFLPDAPEVRRDVADLNESVRRVDEAVRAIVTALKRHRLWDNTLLVYTTDHGTSFPGAKATLFDPGIEIALLMHGPDDAFSGGKTVTTMVSNADLMPTFCEIAGAEPPSHLDGKSLLPLLKGEPRLHERLFVELTYHAAYDPMRGIRTERFKYIRSFAERPFWLPPNVDNGFTKDWYRQHRPEVFRKGRRKEMLFDLQVDPWERHNLANDFAYASLLSELRVMLERWMDDTEDPLRHGHVPPPPEARVTPASSWGPEEGVRGDFDPTRDRVPLED